LRLGADVPFFLGGHNAFVQGIGERLTPLAVPAARYAVIKPLAALSTRDIFEHRGSVRDTEAVILMGSFDSTGRIAWPADWDAGFGSNDLQSAAEARCPEVAQAACWLGARYGNSRMTGSGSAVFARVDTSASTCEPPEAIFPAQAIPPGWVARVCCSLAQHPLVEWAD
jgi:4-diphosphocytidyl-2-C-methyl-D-erythritol kinase